MAGGALLERSNWKEVRQVVAFGLVAIGLVVVMAVLWPEISSWLQEASVAECMAREAGRFPNSTGALAAYCGGLFPK